MTKIYIVRKIHKSYIALWEVQEINNQDTLIQRFNELSLEDNFSLDFAHLYKDKKQAEAFAKLMNSFRHNMSDAQLKYGINLFDYNETTNAYECEISNNSLNTYGIYADGKEL